uniref:Negatively light-regulated protein n=3 Tax=Triticinae TaxID=1648030 RepID=A0A453I925_AEGTS
QATQGFSSPLKSQLPNTLLADFISRHFPPDLHAKASRHLHLAVYFGRSQALNLQHACRLFCRAAREEKEEERGMAGCGEAKTSSVSMDEEACGIEKKFGGMAPKKPLISKDHERAYFDSADWVLGKQAANSSSTAAVESLKPKLKRTPHPQLPPRKPTCASG